VSLTGSAGQDVYNYAPDGKRIYKRLPNGNEEFHFYGITGQKLGTYGIGTGSSGYGMFVLDTNLYFGGKLLRSRSVTVVTDRSSSVRNSGARYFPYGEEQQVTAQDKDKFGGYYRDATSGLDYAQNRYYANTLGRFTSPDPYAASVGPSDPASWNRYIYTRGDPINRIDPSGLEDEEDGDGDGLSNDSGGRAERSVSPDGGGSSSVKTNDFTTADNKGTDENGLLVFGNTSTNQSVTTTARSPDPPCCSTILSLSYQWNFGPVGATIGGLLGGLPGMILGNQIASACGAGPNVSYVPSTNTPYVGVSASCAPAVGGGSGWLGTLTIVPPKQNPHDIAGGRSYNLTINPWAVGTTWTYSPGSDAPAEGISVGTKIPISVGVGYNVCVYNCKSASQ
jgi:RHS repeat-associated protein